MKVLVNETLSQSQLPNASTLPWHSESGLPETVTSHLSQILNCLWKKMEQKLNSKWRVLSPGIVTPCIPAKFNWHFREIHRLHLQGRRVSQAISQPEAGSKQSRSASFHSEMCCWKRSNTNAGLDSIPSQRIMVINNFRRRQLDSRWPVIDGLDQTKPTRGKHMSPGDFQTLNFQLNGYSNKWLLFL
jgi:hypothetical protein